MRLIAPSNMPVLGICAGLQLFNIGLGGKLIQHLDTSIPHRAESKAGGTIADRFMMHPVFILRGTLLSRLYGARDTIRVASYHHQAADPKHLGQGLKVAARAPDGTVEALELKDNPSNRFFLLMQWHPERMSPTHQRTIFGALIEASKHTVGWP
jgi:gamma-glutamyl-gamma-aminobutyrate hydrolase PuuD